MTTVVWNPGFREAGSPYTNEERAHHAAHALSVYLARKGGSQDDDDYNIADLLGDLLHLAASKGLHFEPLIQTALLHFEAEN